MRGRHPNDFARAGGRAVAAALEARKRAEMNSATTQNPQRPLMSCGHYANTITRDTLTPLCDICMNVEGWVD